MRLGVRKSVWLVSHLSLFYCCVVFSPFKRPLLNCLRKTVAYGHLPLIIKNKPCQWLFSEYSDFCVTDPSPVEFSSLPLPFASFQFQVLIIMAAVDSFSLLFREIGRACNCYVETLALIGAFYTAKTCFAFVNDTYTLIRLHFIPRLISRTDLVKLYGKWAVVTGKRTKPYTSDSSLVRYMYHT